MANWFFSEMDLDAIIITLKSSFINNVIGIEFLKHFIKYTNDVKSHFE